MTSLLLLQWVGGKGHQLEQLLPLIPHSHTYVEPFGGGASVLLARPPSVVEVYNDLNWDLVNFFDVVRDPELGEELSEMLAWTPYAHEEFKRAVHTLAAEHELVGVDQVDKAVRLERAWAMFTRQNMGISGLPVIQPGSWSRSKKDSTNVERWLDRQRRFGAVKERMSRVQITNEDAIACIERWDSPQTVFYLDPPYVLETRQDVLYEKEYTDDQHIALLETLNRVDGMCVLSGYAHPLYADNLHGWQHIEYTATAMSVVTDGVKPKRIESVWINPQASTQTTLF
jgi:DNA adenine methylase